MEVIRAKRAGACYGVQRALDMADEVIADGSRAYTLGPLIHNPQVVADLAARGAEAVGSVEDICWEGAAAGDASAEGSASAAGDVPAVVIRSHGVTPQVLAAVEDRGFTVVDATCPHVSRAQHAAAELAGEGCRVIVVGEAGHPEVEGLTAWAEEAGGKVDVVAASEEIPEGLYDPVGVVAQTTQRRENLEAVVAALRAATPDLPIVVDPVMVATSGAHLLPDDAVEALRGVLRHASLITPNLPEAAVLLDEPQANGVDEMIGQATRLLELGPERVLVKGGHGHGAESVDVLASADDVQVLHAPRIDTVNTHGTGCSLSSAIAALRPQRDSWDAAVRDAKDWLSGAIAHADALDIGAGGGPVHHFYRWW